MVIGVLDLDGAADEYQALGFQVTPRGIHPWGTHNRLVQLADQTFLELVTVAEPEKIASYANGQGTRFGAFVRDALLQGEGLSMLVLASGNADADLQDWAAHGLQTFPRFDFGREAVRPDGTRRQVGFRLAFCQDEASPRLGTFTCQQTHPENFWNPAVQVHANGVAGLAALTLVAEDPSDHHVFLQAFTGLRDIRATSSGVTFQLNDHQRIEVLSPLAFQNRFGVEVPVSRDLVARALTFRGARERRIIANQRNLTLAFEL